MRRFRPYHHAGAGVALGLVIGANSYAPLAIAAVSFAAGVLVTVAFRVALRSARVAARFARLAERRVTEELSNEPRRAPLYAVSPDDVILTADEIEAIRREGLRQGHAAGIRAAARDEVRESTRLQMMRDSLDEHWRETRRRDWSDTLTTEGS